MGAVLAAQLLSSAAHVGPGTHVLQLPCLSAHNAQEHVVNDTMQAVVRPHLHPSSEVERSGHRACGDWIKGVRLRLGQALCL